MTAENDQPPLPPQSPEIPPTPETPGSEASQLPVPPQPTGLDLGPGVGINVQQDMAAPERKLPPINILLIAIAGLAVLVGIVMFTSRAKPQGKGAVENVAAIEIPGQNAMLVAITVNFQNTGEKPFWIHDIKGKLNANNQEYSDEAASAVDFERYYEAFPPLREGSQPALLPETKIMPGNSARGTLIVSFPVTQDVFNKRQSISAVIQPYDQPLPVVLTK
jgi:hypothetical protein